MKTQKSYRGFLHLIVFVVVTITMFGCYDEKVAPSPPDTSKMDATQKEKFNELSQRKDALEEQKKRHESNYQEYNKQMQDPSIGQRAIDVFSSVLAPGKHEQLRNMELSQKMTSEQLKIDDLRAEIREVDREMDKMIQESQKSCFPKDAKIVMSDGSLKPIQEIAVNDRVMTYDIGKEEIGDSKINEVYVSDNNHLYILNNTLKATAYERFLTDEGWKKMRDIEIGDKVFNGNQYVIVEEKEKIKEDLVVYNLNVDTSHNFFVTDESSNTFLVHNSGGGGGGGGK